MRFGLTLLLVFAATMWPVPAGATEHPEPAHCYADTQVDAAGDAPFLDVDTYGAYFFCEDEVWVLAILTHNDWASDELDYVTVALDTDGVADNGCGGDYVVLGIYDEGLTAGVLRTPDCDEASWTLVGEALIDRQGSTDFLSLEFDNAAIGSPDSFYYSAEIASIRSTVVERIPDGGRHLVQGFKAPPPPPPPPPRVATETTAALARTRVHSGDETQLDGVLSHAVDNAVVALQRYVDGGWRTVQSTVVQDSRSFSFAVQAGAPGTLRYRAVFLGDDAYEPSVSAASRLTVYRAKIVRVQADPPGADGRRLNGEYVVLANKGLTPIRLSGWSVAVGRRQAVLRGGTLQPGERVRVHTGSGRNRPGRLYLDRSGPLWPNASRTARLVDPSGFLADDLPY